jgi:hypothetical protein
MLLHIITTTPVDPLEAMIAYLQAQQQERHARAVGAGRCLPGSGSQGCAVRRTLRCASDDCSTNYHEKEKAPCFEWPIADCNPHHRAAARRGEKRTCPSSWASSPKQRVTPARSAPQPTHPAPSLQKRSPVKLNTPQSAPLGRVESARAAPDFSAQG